MDNTNVCGECKQCCITFALHPRPPFWHELKLAHTPCRHLCDQGCSIHNQERPAVCIGYTCAYTYEEYKPLPPQWRPDRCGFIAHVEAVGYYNRQLAAAQYYKEVEDKCDYEYEGLKVHNLNNKDVGYSDFFGVNQEESMLILTECQPRKLLEYRATQVRYSLNKIRSKYFNPCQKCLILPYEEEDLRRLCFRPFPNGLFVKFWKSPDYAEELAAWWQKT